MWLPGESHSTLGLRGNRATTASPSPPTGSLLSGHQKVGPFFDGQIIRSTRLAVSNDCAGQNQHPATWLLGLDWDALCQARKPKMAAIPGGASGIGETSRASCEDQARLVAHVVPLIGAEKAPLHLWSDSTVTLGWIRGHPSSWVTYDVANRVSEIQTLTPDAHWHHVPGRENPADCASRGLYPSELVDHSLWWQGPSWLSSESQPWTINCEEPPEDDLPERRVRAHVAAIAEQRTEPEMLLRYSSLQRLLRITAWCRRWLRIHRQDHLAHGQPGLNSADEIEDSRISWLKIIQAETYKEELRHLKNGKPLPTRSSLLKLSPFLDSEGLLRVGGRLKHAALQYDATHPTILPSRSNFTCLIIDDYHKRTLHGGTQLTLCSLRQEYWVPRGRALVKSRISRCLRCTRWRAAIPQPLMGDLPAPRVTPGRPFLHTGVDYAGPIWMRTAGGRGLKATKGFIVVFICLASRAVHLDAASDYTADAFLAALRRFVARRGVCHSLYSDCGTNFVGADKQLRQLFSAASADGHRIATFAAQERIRWRFNPPAAPNFGGLWEAAVKAMKHHLRRVIGDATLTYEEMTTLLAQIEACLNSRPLQPLSDDPEDVAALTPGHFLVGSALSAIPEPSLEREPSARLSRWQLLQNMKDHFWSR
ncbi:uncharacterized protein LOC114931013, partial [Nylanderia fulva]|uniref:uncharacterized protein LOC114931013 n=1 Tax=Nylanderia fulva TaxID=613905 RepID=UPI0010FAEA01